MRFISALLAFLVFLPQVGFAQNEVVAGDIPQEQFIKLKPIEQQAGPIITSTPITSAPIISAGDSHSLYDCLLYTSPSPRDRG